MSGIYQELCNKNTFPSKRIEEAKRKCFVVWKDKRSKAFDAKRETLVYEKKDFAVNEKENKIPSKNILIKWKNERKAKVIPKKKPPFVVGIMKHKIYSPPLSYKPFKPIKQEKKIIRQSFAPKNYKFKPPENLKPTVLSTFVIHHQSPANKKMHKFENVTVRSRAKPLKDSPANKIIKKNAENSNKGDIITDSVNEEPPIFGTLNSLALKFREKTAQANEVPSQVSNFDQQTFEPNQIFKISSLKGASCTPLSFNNPKQQESNLTKNKSAKKEMSCTDSVDVEPPIFGTLNLLKFREEKTAKANEGPKEGPTFDRETFKPTQTITTSTLQEDSYIPLPFNNRKQHESNFTKENKAEKECGFISPTISSCSKQLHNLLEQEDFGFTKLYSKNENNKITKRTSEISSPNLSRISFKEEKKIIIAMEKKVENSNSFQNRGSLINDELNGTINIDHCNVVDEEPPLDHFNLTCTSNIAEVPDLNDSINVDHCNIVDEEPPLDYFNLTNNSNIAKIPENSHYNFTPYDKTEDGEKDSNTVQYDLHSPGIESPVKSISEDNELTENEVNKSKELNKRNSLSLSSTFTILKDDPGEKEKHLNGNKSTLEKVESPLNDTRTLKNQNLLQLSNLNSFDKENTLINDRQLHIKQKNFIPKVDVPNKLEVSTCSEFLKKSSTATVGDSIASASLTSDSKFKLESSPSDRINIFNAESKSIVSETSLESCQKPIIKKNNLNEPADNFLECETEIKSATVLKNRLSTILTNHMNTAEENNEKHKEIIDLSDSPLDQEETDHEKNPALRKLYNNIAKKLFSSPQDSKNKHTETEILFAEKVSDTVSADSEIVKKELSEAVKKQKTVSDDCKSTTVLKTNTNKLQNSPIETIDLISDDEENPESFLSRIKNRFAITTSTSPKLNQETAALTSIENIQHPSRKTLHSPMIVKENSPKIQNISKSTPIEMGENFSLPSDSPDSIISLYLTPRQYELSNKNTLNVNSTEINKNGIGVMPSSENQEVNEKSSTCNQQPMSKRGIEDNIPNLHVVPCETLQLKPRVHVYSPKISAVESPIKMLSLRSRKVEVSPSPRKKRNTPRKTVLSKNNLPDLTDQPLKNNENKLIESSTAIASLENGQNCTHSTTPLQQQGKENVIPILHFSPCKTPSSKQLFKENSAVTNEVLSPMRVLSLRSRKIDVTPSPPKKTLKKTPKEKKHQQTKGEKSVHDGVLIV